MLFRSSINDEKASLYSGDSAWHVMTEIRTLLRHSVSYIYVFFKGYHSYLMAFPGKWFTLSVKSTYFGIRLLEFRAAATSRNHVPGPAHEGTGEKAHLPSSGAG